jgi:methylated-DNA-[protein]-cysteine S-methyltransferase
MQGTKKYYYCIVSSRFGKIIVVGRYSDRKVVRVYLPKQRGLFKSSSYKSAPSVNANESGVRDICLILSDLLRGEPVVFPLDMIDWSVTYPFQNNVLRMEYRIPRGMVSTYGRLARKLHHPRAARAVGTALARNPFPIIIPCHRTIRSDRSLGGYAGGLAVKRRLLELEGLEFDQCGRVTTDRFW